MAIGQSDSQIEVIKNYLHIFYTKLLVIIIVIFVLRSLI